MSIRGCRLAIPYACVRYFACSAGLTPKTGSGGFVWYAYSVIQMRLFPHSRVTSRISTSMLPSVTAVGATPRLAWGGGLDGVSLGEP
jgi:hypothetical protein